MANCSGLALIFQLENGKFQDDVLQHKNAGLQCQKEITTERLCLNTIAVPVKELISIQR